MMKHRLIFITMLAALTFVVGACSSDDAEPSSSSVTKYLKVGTDERPAWTQPNMLQYGPNVMSVQLQLGDTLAYFQSERDLMAAFSGDEIRGVTEPGSTGGVAYFPLTIGSFGGTETLTLKYYCDRLHRIFTITNWTSFDPAIQPIGEDEIHRPRFTAE